MRALAAGAKSRAPEPKPIIVRPEASPFLSGNHSISACIRWGQTIPWVITSLYRTTSCHKLVQHHFWVLNHKLLQVLENISQALVLIIWRCSNSLPVWEGYNSSLDLFHLKHHILGTLEVYCVRGSPLKTAGNHLRGELVMTGKLIICNSNNSDFRKSWNNG